jgi:hypothetical protein
MKIFGVSQSSGVERQLKIERGIEGVVLTLTDHVGGKEQGRIFVRGDEFAAALMEPASGGSTIEGIIQAQGEKMLLGIDVRRNEVLLVIRSDSDGVGDVAVGLDDLQDALEGVISPG